MPPVFGNVVTAAKNPKMECYLKRRESLSDIDAGLPTLIVGLSNAKKCIEGFSILRRHYPKKDLWWTFGRTERRAEYEDDMKEFCKICVERKLAGTEYVNVPVSSMDYSTAKEGISLLKSSGKKYAYDDRGEFFFLYDVSEETIYGISLSTCRFYGIDGRKIVRMASENPDIEMVNGFGVVPYGIRRMLGDRLHACLIMYRHFSQ